MTLARPLVPVRIPTPGHDAAARRMGPPAGVGVGARPVVLTALVALGASTATRVLEAGVVHATAVITPAVATAVFLRVALPLAVAVACVRAARWAMCLQFLAQALRHHQLLLLSLLATLVQAVVVACLAPSPSSGGGGSGVVVDELLLLHCAGGVLAQATFRLVTARERAVVERFACRLLCQRLTDRCLRRLLLLVRLHTASCCHNGRLQVRCVRDVDAVLVARGMAHLAGVLPACHLHVESRPVPVGSAIPYKRNDVITVNAIAEDSEAQTLIAFRLNLFCQP